MNKNTARKLLSLLLSLAMLVSLLAGLSLTASAATMLGTATGYTSASQVNYVTSSGYVANWGARGETATFLTTYAQSYYTGSYSYATLSALSGDSGTDTSFYSSALGSAIHSMLTAKQTSTTSYAGTRDLYKYTDCVNSNYSYISSYYSGTQLTGEWDSGSTWNREHTWPNSKGLEGSDENDIMMLRPTSVSENSSRGNKAYGSSSSYYDPNSEAGSTGINLHGDVARLMLQHLMRWGNTDKFYGTGGVIESRAVLLQWMQEDPVDT
ncbi:MAG: endonuclease, partial [Oscillospiraceae bacterium]|nr:endonuclease [Oscillospiraceae bacterium]